MDYRFYNPEAEIRQSKNNLPHWQQKQVLYFLTWRLAVHPEPWNAETEKEYHRKFTKR
jgi:putative transposase